MKNRDVYLNRRLFLVLGTFIIGSIAWVIFMYNGIYGERGMSQVSVVGISYDSIESLSLLDQIELLEEIEEYNEKTEYILSEYAKRRDALGYFANIKLARFYALNNKVEGSTYYNQAIGLYETKELKYEYAEFLKFNDIEKAAKVLVELLPDMAAIEGLESLGISHEDILDILFTKKQWQTYINYYRQNYGSEFEEIELDKKLKFGIALGNLGRYTEALSILEELNNKIVDNVDFKWWYARSLEELGQVREAKELYKGIG
ncbi:tetratricopeptide repeat protein [Serpentinicella alkaliphila]|uniref:Tetratricopeptide repeat protein n=1 Tax=Serpentinicella alkaliphila TaxID=1734049 RepID=A0A4R2T6U5_9FIRM|nr:tetratricopeptide repeat protein [Serpentinicella alkaliphila]QUH25576.1 tetratricopeptide repeat protein [Serpentinicella alkaliphila]TCP97371.1 hypothetical protein EDD79_104612 [Serpentinicella alkaliphila]